MPKYILIEVWEDDGAEPDYSRDDLLSIIVESFGGGLNYVSATGENLYYGVERFTGNVYEGGITKMLICNAPSDEEEEFSEEGA